MTNPSSEDLAELVMSMSFRQLVKAMRLTIDDVRLSQNDRKAFLQILVEAARIYLEHLP